MLGLHLFVDVLHVACDPSTACSAHLAVNGSVCSPQTILRIPHVLVALIKTLLSLLACLSLLFLQSLSRLLYRLLVEIKRQPLHTKKLL